MNEDTRAMLVVLAVVVLVHLLIPVAAAYDQYKRIRSLLSGGIGVLNLLVFAFAIPPVFIAAIHHVYGLPTWTVGVGLTFLFAAFALAVYTTVRALESGAHY